MGKKVFCLAFCALLFALCFPAGAQQPGKIARIGIIRPEKPDHAGGGALVDAFRQGLGALGYVEGQNIAFEGRWAEGKRERLRELANDLVRVKVDLIVTGGASATRAAKKATTMIPIIMANVSDPVEEGFVASLARPGGNITGLSTISAELGGKRLELLRETVPTVSRVGVLWNANNPGDARELKQTEVVARALGMNLRSLKVRSSKDFDNAFQAALGGRVDALIVQSDALIRSHRKRIIDLAADNRLPAIYVGEQFVKSGGLISYGPDRLHLYRRAATYVDKILKGAKPADLPVEQPTKFELVINLKTAKQLGIAIPAEILLQATKIIR